MKIPLKNFEKEIEDSSLLERWKKYFEKWFIRKLEKTGNNSFEAEVCWEEDYEVYLKLDKNNNIIKYNCDCPYDRWPICKHQISVFYKLREKFIKEWIIEAEVPKTKKSKTKRNPKENMKQYLKWIIEDSISEASYRRWYVQRDMVWDSLEWAETIVWEFKDFLKEKNFQDAIPTLSILIETLIIWLEDVDDSSWEYWWVIEECIEKYLPKLISSIKKNWNQSDIDSLIKEFLELAWNKKIYWFDFEREILEKIVCLVNKNNFIEFKKLVNQVKSRDSYGDYTIIEYNLISAMWDDQEINKFIDDNLEKYDFAMFFVERLIKNKNYKRAEDIVLEHLKWDIGYRNTDLLKKLLEISRRTKDKAKEEKYLFQLFLSEPDLENFNNYKKFLWKDRYSKMKEEIFSKIDKSETASNDTEFPNICLQENDEKDFWIIFLETLIAM